MQLALATALLLQAVQAPVLEFPEPGVDDAAAYDGYATRFYRDSARNAFQVYVDAADGRVVNIWADSSNASAALTVRNTDGTSADVGWGGPGAEPFADGPRRGMRYRLAADTDRVEIGWFLLGTMRQERDFQYRGWAKRPFGQGRFVLDEFVALVDTVAGLPRPQRKQHLALLNAESLAQLRSRLTPRTALQSDAGRWSLLVEHTSLDGRNHMTLELRGDTAATTAQYENGVLSLRAVPGMKVQFDVVVTTDHAPLTALHREQIFNSEFGEYFEQRRRIAEPAEFRRFERNVLGLELLASEEKLMAALPNYATYFGRDSMMAALMFEPITSAAFQEHVIGNVLRKVSTAGDVSHEEALGEQAIRENAAEFSARIRNGREADLLLRDLQAVRENHRMIDDDFQLAVLVGRYLARGDVSAARKHDFLDGHLDALLRNLSRVADLSQPYAEEAIATRLVGFQYRDDNGWMPGSWRDSRPGYANGRFAMDVNVVWVPQALQALERILPTLESPDLPLGDALQRLHLGDSVLAAYLRDPDRLAVAVARWQGTRRHFMVTIDATESQPELQFAALALDDGGRPIPVAHTDVATELFLNDFADTDTVLAALDVVLRPYPAGLMIAGVGPVVANDVYADATVQRSFRDDLYHSPRVVWGREVNLLLLGIARQIAAAKHRSAGPRDIAALLRALDAVRDAAVASGLQHHELWSYRMDGATVNAVRYGTSSDIQLWNLTDLAVQFELNRLAAGAITSP